MKSVEKIIIRYLIFYNCFPIFVRILPRKMIEKKVFEIVDLFFFKLAS